MLLLMSPKKLHVLAKATEVLHTSVTCGSQRALVVFDSYMCIQSVHVVSIHFEAQKCRTTYVLYCMYIDSKKK